MCMNVNGRRKLVVILKDRFDLSYPAIAELLGYADHTAPLHHYKKEKRANVSPEERKQIQQPLDPV
jgi:hypothetical protein